MITPAKGLADEPSTEDTAFWTTARCNRLLRPLASRLSLLRKGILAQDWDASLRSRGAYSNQYRRPRDTRQTGNGATWNDWTENLDCERDPDWVQAPAASRRKLKRKYVARISDERADPNESAALQAYRNGWAQKLADPIESAALRAYRNGWAQPGGTSIATPVISRNHHLEAYSQWTQLKPTQTQQSRFWVQPQFGSTSLKSQEYKDLVRHLRDAYLTFLKVTNGTKHPDGRRGARSLFSTCLRQVPAYIALEEEFQREGDDEKQTDVAVEIYDELAELGTGQAGWKPLRAVARAHGLFLLELAIRDGVIRGSFILELQMYKAELTDDEADGLFSAWNIQQGPLPPPERLEDSLFTEDISPYLAGALIHGPGNDRWGFLWRQLASLLSSHRVPSEWLASKQMIRSWHRVVDSISLNDDQAEDAARLVRSAVFLCCGLERPEKPSPSNSGARPDAHEIGTQRGDQNQSQYPSRLSKHQVALDNTLTSLAARLFASACRTISSESKLQNPASRFLTELVLELLLSIRDVSTTGKLPTGIHQQRIAKFLMADLLRVHPNNIETSTEAAKHRTLSVVPIALQESGIDAALDDLPFFICSLACSRGLEGPEDMVKHWKLLVETLVVISDTLPPSHSSIAWRFRRLALNTALEISTVDASHDFARSLERRFQRQYQMERPVPRKRRLEEEGFEQSPAEVGYRWEEGICEWIAATPAVSSKKPRYVARNAGSRSRSICSSPIGLQAGNLEASQSYSFSSMDTESPNERDEHYDPSERAPETGGEHTTVSRSGTRPSPRTTTLPATALKASPPPRSQLISTSANLDSHNATSRPAKSSILRARIEHLRRRSDGARRSRSSLSSIPSSSIRYSCSSIEQRFGAPESSTEPSSSDELRAAPPKQSRYEFAGVRKPLLDRQQIRSDGEDPRCPPARSTPMRVVSKGRFVRRRLKDPKDTQQQPRATTLSSLQIGSRLSEATNSSHGLGTSAGNHHVSDASSEDELVMS